MLTSPATETASLVETSMFRQARTVAVVGLNFAFLLVAFVYLIASEKTVAGVVLFGALLVWASFRLLVRRDRDLLYVDLAFVVIAALLQPMIVSETISDVSLAATRAIAYPAIVAVGVVEAKRFSFIATFLITAATSLADTILFGVPSITLLAYPFSWAAAIWVHGLIQRAAETTDAAAADARRARLRERVAGARNRFEREHFAILHDTAASTLMMFGDNAGLDSQRLAAQAGRDIDILSKGSQVADPDREVDLVAQVLAVTQEARTSVVVHSPGTIMVPALIAAATSAATREALNNVDRHSGGATAKIDVRPGRLVISDDGVGFDDTQLQRGFGLRVSIEGRMARAGGTGSVTSTPDVGTTVELTWPELPPEPSTESVDARRVERGFQYGLAAAQFLVVIEMLVIGFGGPAAIDTTMSAVTVAVLFLTTAVSVALVTHRSDLIRWLWVGVLMSVGIAHILSLTESQRGIQQNWVSIAVGWGFVAMFTGWVTTPRRVVGVSGVVVGYWVVSGAVRVWQTPTSEMVEYAAFGIASVATMQVAAISCAWVLAEAVRVAEALGEEQHAAATSRAVEEAIQRDYRRHFASLTAGIVDLLRGVSDGTLPVDSPDVRSRARTEYARLRRLFAQADSFDHPVIERLRPRLDAAAERGADVTIEITSLPRKLDEQAVDRLTEAAMTMLDGAQRSVRLVVSAADGQVTVSVVADCSDETRRLVEQRLGGGDFQLANDGDVTWLRVHAPVLVAV